MFQIPFHVVLRAWLKIKILAAILKICKHIESLIEVHKSLRLQASSAKLSNKLWISQLKKNVGKHLKVFPSFPFVYWRCSIKVSFLFAYLLLLFCFVCLFFSVLFLFFLFFFFFAKNFKTGHFFIYDIKNTVISKNKRITKWKQYLCGWSFKLPKSFKLMLLIKLMRLINVVVILTWRKYCRQIHEIKWHRFFYEMFYCYFLQFCSTDIKMFLLGDRLSTFS